MNLSIGRILVVDDSPRDVELIVHALHTSHLANEVAVARDGAEALDYLFRREAFADRPEGNPVVVMLDLKMPKVDGLAVLHQMRNDPKLKYVPVVIMTSSREEQDLVRSYDYGANAYVVKPVDFSGFIEAVKQVGIFWAVINEIPQVGQ